MDPGPSTFFDGDYFLPTSYSNRAVVSYWVKCTCTKNWLSAEETADEEYDNIQGTKIFKYCTCPAGRVTYNFHSSCKHMHLSFKSVCNKENKGLICYMTSSSNSFQSIVLQDECFGKNYLSFLDFTRNYERASGIFVP